MQPNGNTIKAILFDLDNTLYSYEPCNQAGQQAVVVWLSKQLSLSPKKITQLYNMSRQLVHRQLAGQAASHDRLLYLKYVIEHSTHRTQPHLIMQAENIFWLAYFSEMKLRPGIRSLLQLIHKMQLKMVLVTDLTTRVQLSKIVKLKIDRFFDFVITSEEVGHEKPHPAMIQLALKKLQLRPAETILIGDSIAKDQGVAKCCHIPFMRLASPRDVISITNTIKQWYKL